MVGAVDGATVVGGEGELDGKGDGPAGVPGEDDDGVGGRGRVYRGEIHHQPWPLQPAMVEIEVNSMSAAASVPIPDVPPILHFARLLHVAVWPLQSI